MWMLILLMGTVAFGDVRHFDGTPDTRLVKSIPLESTLFPDLKDAIAEKGFVGTSQPKFCIALRGNGQLFIAHFPALARIVERYGIADGIVGGSSAAISLFFYESILDNPAVWDCGGKRCSDEVAQKRVALLLKATPAALKEMMPQTLRKLMDEYGKSSGSENEKMMKMAMNWLENGLPFPNRPLLHRIVSRVANRIAGEKVEEMLAMEGSDLINQKIVQKVRTYLLSLPEQDRHELLKAVTTVSGKLDGEDTNILFRDGIFDFPNLVKLIGRGGNFFAGRGPELSKAANQFFNECADASAGKFWGDFADTPVGKKCEKLLKEWAGQFLAQEKTNPPKNPRLNDFVGEHANTLILASLIKGEGVEKFKQARQEYRKNRSKKVPLNLDFENDVASGYWGRYSSLRAVDATAKKSDDSLLKKFFPLGTTTWGFAMVASISEPGIAKLMPITPNGIDLKEPVITSGSWIDMQPTVVGKAMGCEYVILVNREGAQSNVYASQMAKYFGMNDEQMERLYGMKDPTSHYNRSMRAADAVWCTRWDMFQDASKWKDMMRDAYNSPVYVRPENSFFTNNGPVLPCDAKRPCCVPQIFP